MTPTLADLLAAYRDSWYLPDPAPVEVVLAAVVANRMRADTVSPLLVGPPGSGKTEALRLIDRDELPEDDPDRDALGDVHFVSTFTEAGLVSASPSRDPEATGGLLCELGERGLIVFKDLTTMLAKVRNRDYSQLDMLREVHDGSFRRRTGSRGGREYAWRGKAAICGAVTEEIDRHHNVVAGMGLRLVYFRMPRLDRHQRLDQGRAALAAVGHATEIRTRLTRMAARLLADLRIPTELPALSDETAQRLLLAADVAAQARSAVARDPSTREIEAVDDPEATTRMLAGLRVLHGALVVLGVDEVEAWRVTVKVTWDSIPKPRRLVLDALWATPVGVLPRTGLVADATGWATGPTHRALDDLAAHGLVERHSKGGGEHQWGLASWCRNQLVQVGYEPLRPVAAGPDDDGANVVAFGARHHDEDLDNRDLLDETRP